MIKHVYLDVGQNMLKLSPTLSYTYPDDARHIWQTARGCLDAGRILSRLGYKSTHNEHELLFTEVRARGNGWNGWNGWNGE